jgi:hypothetical protein
VQRAQAQLVKQQLQQLQTGAVGHVDVQCAQSQLVKQQLHQLQAARQVRAGRRQWDQSIWVFVSRTALKVC